MSTAYLEWFSPDVPRQKLFGHLSWFLLWLGTVLVSAFALSPNPSYHGTHVQLGLPPCYSVVMFGKPCPGCGLTTSFVWLAHGHIAEAFVANPLGPMLFVLWTVSAWLCLYGYIRRARLRIESGAWQIAVGTTVVAIVVFGVMRFILTPAGVEPFWPFLRH